MRCECRCVILHFDSVAWNISEAVRPAKIKQTELELEFSCRAIESVYEGDERGSPHLHRNGIVEIVFDVVLLFERTSSTIPEK